MEKINLNKELIIVLKTFNKYHDKSYRKDISELIHYDAVTEAIYNTDANKLMVIPNNHHYDIADSMQSFTQCNNINYVFYSKYSKTCDIVLNDNQLNAMLNNNCCVDSYSYNLSYPDLSQLKFKFNLTMDLDVYTRDRIYNKLTIINKVIKEYNVRRRLLKLPEYDIKKAYIVFKAVTEVETKLSASIEFPDMDDESKKECFDVTKIGFNCLNLIDDYTVFYDNLNFKVTYNFLQLLVCFEALKKLDRDSNIRLLFDTNHKDTSPIKLELNNEAYILLMPIRINN